jgi:RNA polymerase sigma factor (sigma-70 family)
MGSHGTITRWIRQLKEGEAEALGPIWAVYCGRLVRLARHKLGGKPLAHGDEEDVALSALKSFWRGVDDGRFPDLEDRNDLWQVLVMLTVRKAIDFRKRAGAEKRGGAFERSDTELLAELVSREPTPESAAELAEEIRRRLDALDADELRAVALAKMQGYTNEEIAAQLGRSMATVERKLRLIRKAWERDLRK